jgi:hypothetical protein
VSHVMANVEKAIAWKARKMLGNKAEDSVA